PRLRRVGGGDAGDMAIQQGPGQDADRPSHTEQSLCVCSNGPVKLTGSPEARGVVEARAAPAIEQRDTPAAASPRQAAQDTLGGRTPESLSPNGTQPGFRESIDSGGRLRETPPTRADGGQAALSRRWAPGPPRHGGTSCTATRPPAPRATSA